MGNDQGFVGLSVSKIINTFVMFRRKTIIGVFLFCLAAAALPLEAQPRTLVVYYSRTGQTKKLAEKLAEKFRADIQPLRDKRRRTGPAGFTRAGKDAIFANLTELEDIENKPSDYDIILIGTPSWYGNMTPAVRTFLSDHDFSRKMVGFFATTNVSGVENALEQMVKLTYPNEQTTPALLAVRKADFLEAKLEGKISIFYEAVLKDCLDCQKDIGVPGCGCQGD